jgi:hypothetical protein
MRTSFSARMFVIATLSIWLTACGDTGSGPLHKIQEDVVELQEEADIPAVEPDTGAEFDNLGELPLQSDLTGWEGVDFGPCESDDDCDFGYCIDVPGGKVCTHTCIQDCPAGWTCKGVDMEVGLLEFICLPNYYDLCAPCTQDLECGVDEDFCVNVGGEGTFCGVSCESDEDCPERFVCNSVKNSLGNTLKQCLPLSGSCTCTVANEGETRTCELENEYGVCPGEMYCEGKVGWSVCDATEPTAEICDGKDNDCDGAVDNGFADADKDSLADCVDDDDDNDEFVDEDDNCPLVANPAQLDFDGDDLGNQCDPDDDDDGDPDVLDCAPLEPLANHDAKEVCDGVDNNCNNQVDEGYADHDKDGLANCVDPDDDNDGDADQTDCSPLNKMAYNGALEVCDGIDNNCNDKVDEGFEDIDGDGQADCSDPDADGDGDPNSEDCAPYNDNIYNGADEVCDGIDNNCNNQVDEGYPDFDLDGLANCVDGDDDNDGDDDDNDCAPLDASKHNGAAEGCDGVDNNCNGKVDEGFPNFDGDGEADCIDLDDDDDGDVDVVDCNPYNPAVYSTAVEVCDGQDNDCNLVVDDPGADGCTVYYKDKDDDGWGMENKSLCICMAQNDYTAEEAGDCDDSTWSINPGGNEVCNNQDDDCDGVKDNPGSLGCLNHYADSDKDTYGSGAPSCICWPDETYGTTKGGDCDEDAPGINPGAEEICDGKDNNCNNLIDEGVASTCGDCDPTCHRVVVGVDGNEAFTLDDENSSNVSKTPEGGIYGTAAGYYRHVIPGATFGTTSWAGISADADVLGSGSVKIRVRAGGTISSLPDKSWSGPYGPYPPNAFPLDLSAIPNLTGKYLEVELQLVASGGNNSVTIHSFYAQYHSE